MSKYGLDYYGIGKYGSGANSVVDFDASPVIALADGYRQIFIKWISPSGDWGRIRLVRNTYGFPLTVDDGTIILDEPRGAGTNYYTDTGEFPDNIGLRPGISYHYSVFVFANQSETWVKAGNALAISIKDFGSFDYMWNSLPSIYKTSSLNAVTDNSDNPDLRAFLKVFAVEYDLFKTHSEILLKTYDTAYAYAPIIPAMLHQFGLAYEPELGLQQSRILLRNAVYLNKKKGSLDGIRDFIKAFTGYDQETKMGKNIMLNYNDSSFEETIGSWEVIDHATLEVVPPSTVTPYSEPSLPSLFPNKILGSLQVNTTNGGDAEIACGLSAPRTKGIPVKEGFVYTFSIYTQTFSSSKRRDVHVDIRWYDRMGEELSRAGEYSILNPFGSWGRVATTGTAPVNAYFAVPYVRIEGVGNNEHHWFDAAQFEESALGATSFEEARQVKIILKATRVNELMNPSFEAYIEPWVATNATISRDLTLADEGNNSAVSLKVVPTSAGAVELTYDEYAAVNAGFWYTISCFVRTGFTGNREDDLLGSWGIRWYDANKTLISTVSGTQQNLTEFYVIDRYYRTDNILTVFTVETTSLSVGDHVRLVELPEVGLDGEYVITASSGRYFQVASIGDNFSTETPPTTCWVQDLKLDFIRNSFSALSPDNAAFASPFFTWSNAELGEQLNIDSALLERSSVAKPYFDGSSGFTSVEDLIWENNETYANRSHYYKNRVATELRLIEKLPDYLMLGSTFALYLAQPEA